MKNEEIIERINGLFPSETEEQLLRNIGLEVEKTKEFLRLAKARREYPDLTIGETSISIWIHGVPEENYAEPFEFSDKEENLFTELIAPVSVEYAGFADYATNDDCEICEGESTLTIARNYHGLSKKQPHPINLDDYPELNKLFEELENLESKKLKECIRLHLL